jgi:integrase
MAIYRWRWRALPLDVLLICCYIVDRRKRVQYVTSDIEQTSATLMQRVRITKRLVDSLRPGQTVWDKELAGFGVRLQRRDPSFVLKYVFRGRQRFYTIGRHGALTVDQARTEARRLLGLVASGVDPSEKVTAETNGARPLTVAQLCERYLAEGPSFKPDKKASSWITDRSNIERHIIPLLGRIPAASLTESEVVVFVAKVVRGETKKDERTGPRGRAIVRGGNGVASRALSVLGAMFSFGVRLGLLPTNPTKNVIAPKGKAPGRFLTGEEWVRLGAAMSEARATMPNAGFIDAVNLIALTGCRKSEICNLTWREVDFAQGFLRLTNSKVGPRAVPLGDDAIALLSSLKETAVGEWVFPSRLGTGPIVGLQKVWTSLRAKAALPSLRIHDLRHSFASEAINSGASLYLTGSVLGHRQAATTQRYAHLQSSPVRAVASSAAARIQAALKKTKDVS